MKIRNPRNDRRIWILDRDGIYGPWLYPSVERAVTVCGPGDTVWQQGRLLFSRPCRNDINEALRRYNEAPCAKANRQINIPDPAPDGRPWLRGLDEDD